MSTIAEREEEIIEEFELFDDWLDKYEYILDIGKKLQPYPDEFRNEEHRVHGCQSQVWLHSFKEGERIRFMADSDAIITKGLIALLIRALDDRPSNEILKAELKFIDKIGMRQHLSPNRSNGLSAMIAKMKSAALF